MNKLIKLVEKAHDVTEVFDLSINELSQVLSPSMNYVQAKSIATKTLQSIADRFASPDHPIKLLLDFYLQDGSHSRFSAYSGEAWIIINLENMTDEDWVFKTTPQDLENVIFKTAQTFTKEMIHYGQFVRNWSYHENKADAAPFKDSHGDFKASAALAAQELVRRYETAAMAVKALRDNAREAAKASPSLMNFLKPENRENLRRFLTDLYGQLENFKPRG